MEPIADRKVYLERMAKPLREKLRVAEYLPSSARTVLDVGCANGAVTLAMARLFPDTRFHGIDLDEGFIAEAQTHGAGVANVTFERAYLRELLARPERYGAVTFVSVLHEFFSYGEGISSVLKAVADAHEILFPGGVIVIRDMILPDYTRRTDFQCQDIIRRIGDSPYVTAARDFEAVHGPLDSIYQVNHFLLKYLYEENWERECREHYVPVSFEQYEQLFLLLGMRLEFEESYLIEYLRARWREDFGLTDRELSSLRSTGFLVAKKG